MKLASFIGRLYATVLGAAIQGPTALGWARIAIDANLCRLYAATRGSAIGKAINILCPTTVSRGVALDARVIANLFGGD